MNYEANTIVTKLVLDDGLFPKKLNTVIKEVEQIGNKVKSVTKIFDESGKMLSKVTSETESNKRSFQSFYLSIMFGAMMIERTLTRVFDNWKNSYFELTRNTTKLGQENLRLTASLSMLGMTIMTALEPFLVPLIEWVVNLINWFVGLDPWIQQIIGGFVVFGGIIAGFIVTGVSFKLMIDGWKSALQTFGLATEQAGKNAGELSSKLSSAWLPIGIAAILALAIIISGWDHFSAAIQIQSKMTTDALKGDWESYKEDVIVQDNEIEQGIFWGLTRIGIGIENAVLGFARSWVRYLEFTHQISEESAAQITKTLYDAQIENTKKFLDNEKLMNMQQIEDMMKAGVSVSDLVQIYQQQPQVLNLVRDASSELGRIEEYNTALKALNINAIKNQSSASNDLTNQLQKEKDALSALNDQTERQLSLAGTGGFAGTYTFGGGAATGYANQTFTAAQLQAKMAADIKARASAQSGGFVAKEGLAYVHTGETIAPSNTNIGDIHVNITTGAISSPADENELAKKVSEVIMQDVRNYTKFIKHF